MKAQTAKRAIMLQEWAAQIKERIQSGQTVKDWCAMHGVAQKTYYYRLKRVREEMLEAAESRSSLVVPKDLYPKSLSRISIPPSFRRDFCQAAHDFCLRQKRRIHSR